MHLFSVLICILTLLTNIQQKVIMFKKIKQKLSQNKYKILAGVSFVAAGYLLYYSIYDDRNIKLSTFMEALNSDQLDEVVVKGDVVYFRSLTSDWFHSVIGSYPIDQLFREIKMHPNLTFACQQNDQLSTLLLANIAITGGALYAMDRIMNRRVETKKISEDTPTNTIQQFDSFYGGDNIKKYLKEILSYIRSPEQFKNFGLRIRRGILLHGPPGTGKTMLARIIANEANLAFISSSASEFEEIFVGVGPKKIRDIFESARKNKNGCIIFIDELDAIGSRVDGWQTKQQRSTINQLLCEIDGFSQNEKIFVIGATNNIQLVDPALMRPGRFDLKIHIKLPSQEERSGILLRILKNKKIPHKISKEQSEQISKLCEGWSGADIENLINESGYQAFNRNQKHITAGIVKETIKTLKKNNES